MGGVEALVRRDRLIVGASLAGVVVLAWLFLWQHAAHADMALVPAVTFVMWVIMMAGMMLPSAAPTVLMYSTMVRRNAERGSALPAAWIFVSGYVLVWAGFSVAATLLQVWLEKAGLLTPMMTLGGKWLGGALVLAAGLYQLTPLKNACLANCREPVQFFLTRWRPGIAGALRMGIHHGAYCVGCCWLLMLLLFVVGVMNLAWVALIAGFVFLEKLLPAGRLTSRLAGAALIVAGVAILALAG